VGVGFHTDASVADMDIGDHRYSLATTSILKLIA
jgi:hypothetical protein